MSTDFLHGVESVTVATGARTVQTVRSSVIGLIGTAADADDASFPVDTPVLVTNPTEFAKIGATGSLPAALKAIFDEASAMVVVIRVTEGADATATNTALVGGVDAPTGHYTGMQAFRSAESIVGVAPKLLIAPGFTSDRPNDAANPIVTGLLSVADRVRAHVVACGPSTTDADALTWVTDFSSRRLYVVDPKVNGGEDTAARTAALIAKVDQTEGFWQSPSNHAFIGVLKTDRAIDFVMGDPNSRANLLNSENIATVIRDGGFYLWGNRTTSADPKWAFLSVSRTADMIDVSIMKAHRWAVDKAITKGYVDDVVASVNGYLRQLKARGAILGGKCWFDPALNTAADITAGHPTFSYDFTAPAPAERVTFQSAEVDTYVSNLFTVG